MLITAQSGGDGKKLYTRPHLQVYGDMREVTQATGNSATARTDGGSPANHSKTQ
jgi:hypothetical protein